jgi:nickel superoxide dismutase
MSLFSKLLKPVYAHCDLPCGIYETDTMNHAVATCVRMTEKIALLPETKGEKSDAHNDFVRAVSIKERHAQICKEQLWILWSDYFKSDHLQKFPDLHTKIWLATKQCSKVKQSISKDQADTLQEMVAEITQIFKESKA